MSLYDIMVKNRYSETYYLSKKKFDELSEMESGIRCDFCGRFDIPTIFEPDFLDEHVCWDCLTKETKDHPGITQTKEEFDPTLELERIRNISSKTFGEVIEESTKLKHKLHNLKVKFEVLSLETEQIYSDLFSFNTKLNNMLNVMESVFTVEEEVGE